MVINNFNQLRCSHMLHGKKKLRTKKFFTNRILTFFVLKSYLFGFVQVVQPVVQLVRSEYGWVGKEKRSDIRKTPPTGGFFNIPFFPLPSSTNINAVSGK